MWRSKEGALIREWRLVEGSVHYRAALFVNALLEAQCSLEGGVYQRVVFFRGNTVHYL